MSIPITTQSEYYKLNDISHVFRLLGTTRDINPVSSLVLNRIKTYYIKLSRQNFSITNYIYNSKLRNRVLNQKKSTGTKPKNS